MITDFDVELVQILRPLTKDDPSLRKWQADIKAAVDAGRFSEAARKTLLAWTQAQIAMMGERATLDEVASMLLDHVSKTGGR